MCILKCQVLWYLPLTSHSPVYSPTEPKSESQWGAPKPCPGGQEASFGEWPLTRVLTEEWELPGEGVRANKGKEGLSQDKDNDGKIIWPAITFCIYHHFLNSFSIYTGHELGSYEIISQQCRSTLLSQTLICEMWTHNQMESYYHFAINGFLGNKEARLWVALEFLHLGLDLHSAIVGGNLGQLEASDS